MRPCGEVRAALLRALGQMATADRGPTLAELAAKACVGRQAARRALDNMRRAGDVRIARARPVAHRNRPVAEYELAAPTPAPARELDAAVLAWVA